MPIGSNDEHTLAPGQEKAEKKAKKERKSAPLPSEEINGGRAAEAVSKLQSLDQSSLRKKTIGVGVVLAIFTLFSLCIDLYGGGLVSPLEVLQCYGLWFSQLFASIMGSSDVLTSTQIMEMHHSYYYLLSQAVRTFETVLCGMLLALAGTLYQNVFKNPIASPSMLGVSGGVQLGYVVLVLVFGTAAAEVTGISYLFTYGFAILNLALLFSLTKIISGRGRPLNIVNMLVVGTLLSQLINVIVNYVTWFAFDDNLWEVYNSLNESLQMSTDALSLFLLVGMAVLAVTPVMLLRFRMNVLSLSEEDIRMLGVDSHKIQLIALACGTTMMVAGQVAVGTVSMLSLVVPHISRAFFGAEFRKQFWGNVFIGALLLIVCRDILSLIPGFATILPIGTVVSVIVLPAFVWIIATQQRSWS